MLDDDRSVADTFVMVLKSGGFDAVAAYSGEEAIELARQTEYDALLTDAMTAPMNGVEAALTIRHIRPNCRVLLVSGRDMPTGLLGDVKRLGHNFRILPKPIHPLLLLEFLRETVSEAKAEEF